MSKAASALAKQNFEVMKLSLILEFDVALKWHF